MNKEIKCPKCGKETLDGFISYSGWLGKRYKHIITYCINCNHENEHVFVISNEQYMMETGKI